MFEREVGVSGRTFSCSWGDSLLISTSAYVVDHAEMPRGKLYIIWQLQNIITSDGESL